MSHDFEDVEIKINAPRLLEDALKRKRKKCVIATGAMSDPYIPVKENLRVVRECLCIIEKYGAGLAIQTKSSLILRDLDLLKKINARAKCVVQMTLTTFDENLCKIIEPNVSTTKERFETLKIMRDNGITTVVWLCPVLPFINDTKENVQGILDYCVEARVYGIMCFEMGVTLRQGNREYFYANLDKHFPKLKRQYQNLYGNSYVVQSPRNAELMKLFYAACAKNNIAYGPDALFAYLSAPEEKNNAQMELFYALNFT
jgi:DNA repair photolyase